MSKRFIRPIRIEGDVAFVTLTKGYEAIIDAADVHLVDLWNWHVQPVRKIVYASRSALANENSPKQTIFMHRVLMAAPDDIDVDHENGNGLDNRRSSNLRIATQSQNQFNQGINRANTSGIKGVCWHKKKEKWEARIQINGKNAYLGRFTDVSAAADAYAKASAEYHGEFGRLK